MDTVVGYVLKLADGTTTPVLSIADAQDQYQADAQLWRTVGHQYGSVIEPQEAGTQLFSEPNWVRQSVTDAVATYQHKDTPDSFWERMRLIHGDDVHR